MKIIADLHTHTIASTHAYSTVTEMVQAAEQKWLSAIAITDHGPATPDSPYMYHFANLKVLPRKIGNVVVLRGAEANVIDFDGNIDICEDESVAKSLDLIIASMHYPVMPHEHTKEDYTKAWRGVIENPYVDILGHIGDGRYPFDYDEVIKQAGLKGKIVELNNASFNVRPGTEKNCRLIAEKCLQYGVKVAVTSDAHYSGVVGKFTTSMALIESVKIPSELVVNSSVDNLADYLNSRPGKHKIIF